MIRCWNIGMAGTIAALCLGLAGERAAADEAGKSTLENLPAAYDEAANAEAQYQAYAVKAGEEGYRSVAVLFHAAAKAEERQAAHYAADIIKQGVAQAAGKKFYCVLCGCIITDETAQLCPICEAPSSKFKEITN